MKSSGDSRTANLAQNASSGVLAESAKVVCMPVSFDRKIKSITPDPDFDQSAAVEFVCGHIVWFAAKPDPLYDHHCSLCFNEYMEKRRAAGKDATKRNEPDQRNSGITRGV